jgi:ABC-2 type transport system permease protein
MDYGSDPLDDGWPAAREGGRLVLIYPLSACEPVPVDVNLVRLGMGILQAIALAIVPWIGMLFAAHVASQADAISRASFEIFLLLGGGIVFLATSLLISSVVEGEYTAPIVSFGGIIMLVYALSSKRLIPYSPWAFMMGLVYFHRQTPFVIGPIPWLRAGAFVSIAALLTILAIKVIQRRDF